MVMIRKDGPLIAKGAAALFLAGMMTSPRRFLGEMMEKQASLHMVLLAACILIAGCAGQQRPAGQPAPAGGSASCQPAFSLGYQIVPFSGKRQMAIWYPRSDPPGHVSLRPRFQHHPGPEWPTKFPLPPVSADYLLARPWRLRHAIALLY